MKTKLTQLLWVFLLLQTAQVKADLLITGVVQVVYSGDQLLLVNPELGQQPVRLAQIDAPEFAMGTCKAQPWADVAQKALSQQVLGMSVQASCLERLDAEGFALCQLLLDGENINQWMLSQGHAWLDRSLGSNIWLQQLEQEAKRKRSGLWTNASTAVPPWQQKAQCTGKQR